MGKLTYGQVRGCALKVLASPAATKPRRVGYPPTLTFDHFQRAIGDIAHDRGFRDSGGMLSGDDADTCVEVVWDMMCEGLLNPVFGVMNNMPGWDGTSLRLTDRGRAASTGDGLLVNDVDGYLHAIRTACRELVCAETVLTYTAEAVRANRTGLHLAVGFMSGAATDAALNEMIEAFVASDMVSEKMVGEYENLVKRGVQIAHRFNWFTTTLKDARNRASQSPSAKAFQTDKDLSDWLSQLLEGLAHTMSIRNAVGHPERLRPLPEDAQVSLVQLRPNLERLGRLVKHFRSYPGNSE